VSVFADLEPRQNREPLCTGCGESYVIWRLVAFQPENGVAVISWLEDSLVLILKLGEKLEPSKRRKTGATKRVEHYTVTSFTWRSTHLCQDQSATTSKDQTESDRLADSILSAAHSYVTSKFPISILAQLCPNTYSLASTLKKIGCRAAPAHTYCHALYKVSGAFYPFSVKDNVVTVGIVSTALGMNMHVEVDFSSGFSNAKSTVRLVRTIGGVQASTVRKIAECIEEGPEYISLLAFRLREYFQEKEKLKNKKS